MARSRSVPGVSLTALDPVAQTPARTPARTGASAPNQDWHDGKKFTVEGLGYKDLKSPYDRLPLSVRAVGEWGALFAGGGAHYGHVIQVAMELVVVEAEADHEAVGDFEAAEVDRYLDDAAGGAVEEGAHGE
jgi:hypothetical protein